MVDNNPFKNFIVNEDGLLHLLQENMTWIKKSFEVNNNLGSSASSGFLGNWSKPYPETTGYLLGTLINASQVLSDQSLLDLAQKQISYFESIQFENGGFQISRNENKSLVFDSSQILLGLCQIYIHNKSKRTLNIAKKTYNYLIACMNDIGYFVVGNYVEDYNPAYYTRIVWALILFEKTTNKEHKKSLLLLTNLLELKNKNHFFKKLSFHNTPFALTHNLIYTYRGIWESALLLNDKALQKETSNSVSAIVESTIFKDNMFYGEYNEDWKANKTFVCSVGNAQLVCLLIRIINENGNTKLFNTIPDLMNPLIKSQRKFRILNKGAITSSIPIWGKYQRFKYTNWTQKFFSDALMSLISYCQG